VTVHSDDELDELLGAYALDAVDDDERREIEEYLSRSPRAREEVRLHRETATFLAYGGAPAPDGLWDRIAGSLEEQPPAPGPSLAKVLPAGRPHGRTRWVVAALGAVAAAVIAVLGVRVVQQGRHIDRIEKQLALSPLDAAAAQALASPTSQQAQMAAPDGTVLATAVVEQSGVGYFIGKNLPALPSNRTYQLWSVKPDGSVVSLGLLGTDPKVAPFHTDSSTTVLAITNEVAGGVPVTAQKPAAVGKLA
jgi:anti-sigma-K factor RskA